MSADDGPRSGREVAYRLFAAEYEDADLEHSESDEERAPNYVVTPTGARVNRLFAVGVLTQVESVADDVLRARVADPTGAFVVYAGQYQPEAVAFLEAVDPPAFVAVTGKARTFRPEDGDRVYTSVRPESVNEVDAATRDRWVVRTAEHTLDRVATMAEALDRPERGDDLRDVLADAGVEPGLAAGVPLAVDHYGTTAGYLAALREVTLGAVRVVTGDAEAAGNLDVAPGEGGETDADLSFDGVVGETGVDVAGAAAPAGTGDTAGTVAGDSADGTVAGAGMDDGDGGASSTDAGETVAADAARGGVDGAPDAAAAEEPAAGDDAAGSDGAEEPAAGDEAAGSDGAEVAEASGGADAAASQAETGEAVSGSETAAADAEPADGSAPDEDAAADSPAADDEEPALDDAEREAVREEHDVGFTSGNDVPDAGEADIDTPDAEDLAEADEAATDDATDAADDGGDADDLEDAVVETMRDLGGGDAVDRAELLAAVSEAEGAAESAVEDAVQDALMAGRCYQSGDDELTPI